MKIRDCMSGSAISVAAEESAAVAARVMARHNVGSLPVRGSGGKLVGIVTDRDLVLRVLATGEDPGKLPVGSIMTARVSSVSPEDDLAYAGEVMAREQVRRLPVVERGKLTGVVSLADLTRYREYTMETAQALTEISRNVKHR